VRGDRGEQQRGLTIDEVFAEDHRVGRVGLARHASRLRDDVHEGGEAAARPFILAARKNCRDLLLAIGATDAAGLRFRCISCIAGPLVLPDADLSVELAREADEYERAVPFEAD
jgi:hypothetical protein